MKKRIMLVDDNITNLTAGGSALQGHYDVLTVNSGERALQLLEKIRPDLILLDVNMPEMDGYQTIQRIKANIAWSEIPVIFLTAKADVNSELEGLSLGAVDYIHKPFSVPLLQKRVELHLLVYEQKKHLQDFNQNLQTMVENKTAKVQHLQDTFISTFAELVEFRDETTGGHIQRTQLYLKLLAEKMMECRAYEDAFLANDIKWLMQSSQLHDVGKIYISDSILNKPGKLTKEEYEAMKLHTVMGQEAIAKIVNKVHESKFLNHASIMAYSHHERWDGLGYPLGLSGEAIPIQGRLMAIADVYDALISSRPYKKAYTHEEAVRIIVDGKGSQFDPLLVDLFEKFSAKFAEISENVS